MNKLAITLGILVIANTAMSQPQNAFLAASKLIGAIDPNQQMHVTVWLNLRNKTELKHAVQDIYNQNSPRYQKFLTKDELSQHYLPSPEAEQAVQRYFTAHGMNANIVHHTVRISAAAWQLEPILHVKINRYRFQNKIVYANANAPTVSRDIRQYISDITGLDNIPHFHPMIGKSNHRGTNQTHSFHLDWDGFAPQATPTNQSLNGFSGAQLQTALNLAQVQPIDGTAINGAGQTMVIIDGCGTNSAATIMNDANQYNTVNAITLFSSANFTVINPDGSPFTSCTAGNGWDAEIALDVESSHTIAAGANTVLVLAANGGDSSNMITAVNDVVTTLVNSPTRTIGGFANASVVSNSWGATEGSSEYNALENTFLTAAASGIAFNFSTGDCGDDTNPNGACLNAPFPSATSQAAVNYPASSTYITAIGGTSLFVGSNWDYAFESGWGSYFDGSGFEGGGGGGISTLYGPATWQSPISTFIAGGYSGTIGSHTTCDTGSSVCRALPDIAMLADWNTGLSIYYTGSNPNPAVYGGTSLSTPLFSGVLTLINQARTLLGQSALGQAAPYLYNNHADLVQNQALHLVIPPHQIIDNATFPPYGAPLSAFTLDNLTFSWDSSLTIEPEAQFWNDVVGVGTPNIPSFVAKMARF